MRSRPVVVFTHAHQRGGVERIAWQSLHQLATLGPVVFVGGDLDPPIAGVEHVPVRVRRAGATAPWRFRRAAGRAVAELKTAGDRTVSFGANCPPGDVCVVNSVHRSWLRRGRTIRIGRIALPNAVRWVLPRHLVLLALERTYFRTARARRVVVVSPVVATDLASEYGVPIERTVVIPNGYSAEQCSPERRRAHRDECRSAWGIGEKAVVLLFVANELHRKGFDCLLEAVAQTDDALFEVHVVGRAPIDGYAARIASLGLDGRVRYHGSVDIGLAHAAADALVLPTQYEAFALTVVEALASGLPVVTTDVPGAADLVEHGVNGLVQRDPLDAAELAGLLRQIADPTTRTRLGDAAPSAVAELEWGHLARRLDTLVQERR